MLLANYCNFKKYWLTLVLGILAALVTGLQHFTGSYWVEASETSNIDFGRQNLMLDVNLTVFDVLHQIRRQIIDVGRQILT